MMTKLKIDDLYQEQEPYDDFEDLEVQEKKQKNAYIPFDEQFLYLGRYVSKNHFTAFLYGDEGTTLAKNYNEFARLVATGNWFESLEEYKKAKSKEERKEKRKKKKLEDEIKQKGDESENSEIGHEVIEYGADS